MKPPTMADYIEMREILVRQEVDTVRSQTLFEAMCVRIEALEAFAEDVRDFTPEVISGRRHDPQNDVPDTMPVDEFYAFQAEAEAIVGAKRKKVTP